jgi:hypothetical protein
MAEPVIEVRSDVDRPVPPGWQRMRCAEGTYYWHSATDTSQWEYPTGHPHQHHQRQDYSNVERLDNKMVIEDDLYSEPPCEDPKVLLAESRTGKATANKRNYENVDIVDHGIQRPAAPPHAPPYPPQKAKSEPVYSTAEGIENVYDKPRHSSQDNTLDYDIPRRSRFPVTVSVPSVPSGHLASSDRGVSSKQETEVHYSVPPSRDRETDNGGAKTVQTKDPQQPRSKPSIPKPYKPKSDLVTQIIQERKGKGKEAPRKPARRAMSEDRTLAPDPISDDVLYAEPWDRKVPAKGDGGQHKKYQHLGSVTPHGNKTSYDQLMTSVSAPCSPVAKSAQEEYSHLESKLTRNLDEKEKLRRLQEAKLKKHSYEVLDKEFEEHSSPVHQELHDDVKATSGLQKLSEREMLKQDTKEVVTVEPADDTVTYEDLSDHEQFESKGGDGDPVDNQWRQDKAKHQNFEDLEDELAWDNTPIEAALKATQSPKPPTSSTSMDCSLGGEEVYAVVEQKKKKAKMTNKDQELPDGWEIVNDNDRTYYWHVPTGATQWERPSANSTHEMAQQSAEDQPPPIPMRTNEASVLLEAVQSSATDTDVDGHVGLASRLQELKTADMRYSSLNIGGSSPKAKRRQLNTTAQLADGVRHTIYIELCITVCRLGYSVVSEGSDVSCRQCWLC